MQTLKNWTVRRSGATMTVTGLDVVTGLVKRVTGVTSVEMQGFDIVAVAAVNVRLSTEI